MSRAAMRVRSATRRLRALPNFIVIGGQRCGSTSLHTILGGHPQVLEASHKELHFFDNNHLRGLDFYRRLFPLREHMAVRGRRLGAPVVTGEASPYYIFHPAVPARVAAALPDVKLVAVLRDPVDRAHSHYQLAVRGGKEALGFSLALDAEPGRLEGEEERLLADPSYISEPHRRHSYMARGIYVDQLRRWHEYFPREQVLVIRSEDLFTDTETVYGQVSDFLGLQRHRRGFFESRNRVSYDRMAAATRQRLRDHFAEPNQRLYEYLGRDLGWQ